MINRQATALTLTAISILFSSAVFADTTETQTADMHVKLTVQKSCQVSVGDMDFGSHASSDGAIDATATAAVTCTNGTSYNLSSDDGHTYAMKNAANSDTVAYTLSSVKNGTNDLASTGIAQTGTGAEQLIPIYGNVTSDALALASAGDYTDTVTLTVSY
ncbi:TPA: spore coat U domain-containing protein [Citrobacter freundii]